MLVFYLLLDFYKKSLGYSQPLFYRQLCQQKITSYEDKIKMKQPKTRKLKLLKRKMTMISITNFANECFLWPTFSMDKSIINALVKQFNFRNHNSL